MHLKMSSAKWRSCCPVGDEFTPVQLMVVIVICSAYSADDLAVQVQERFNNYLNSMVAMMPRLSSPGGNGSGDNDNILCHQWRQQCWFLISEVMWHSPKRNFTMKTQSTFQYNEFENYTFKSLPHLPGANELIPLMKWQVPRQWGQVGSVPWTFPSGHVIREPFQRVVHDDVVKWKHCPHYWPFVRGIHRSPVNYPHKGQWRGALMFPKWSATE